MADDISGETLALAAGALARAAAAPTPEAIAELARDALSEERDDMTPAEIRALAATALLQAQQISRLMTRLADLLDTPAGDGARG